MRPLLLALALAAATLAACAGPRRAEVCREYRDLSCLTQQECALDRNRGCLVCACRPWDAPPAQDGAAAAARPEGDAGRPPPPRAP